MKKKKAAFIVVESHLEKRFSDFAQRNDLAEIKLDLRPRFSKVLLWQFFKRLTHKTELVTAFQKIVMLDAYDCFVLSNAEGYIAANLIKFIKKAKPEVRIVVIQHGDFELIPHTSGRAWVTRILNSISRLLNAVDVSGYGFGGLKVDRYIVYNQNYKDFLQFCGYSNNEVVIGSNLIFNDLLPPPQLPNKRGKSSNVIFVMQPLAKMGIVPQSKEIELNDLLIEYLKQNYDEVFLRQHPFADSQFSVGGTIPLTNEMSIEDQIIDIGITALASFCSSILLKLERWPLQLTAFYHPELKKFDTAFWFFRKVMELDTQKGEVKLSSRFPPKDNKHYFYQEGETDIEKVLFF